MKHQQVSVDYWAMGKSMLTCILLMGIGWLMFRMFNTVIMLPRRLRSQQLSIHETLADLQRRFPGMNITEEDLKNAEKEIEDYLKEQENEQLGGQPGVGKDKLEDKENVTEPAQPAEDKKTI